MILRALLLCPVTAGLAWAVAASPLVSGGGGGSQMADRIASGDQYEIEAMQTAAKAAGRQTGLFCSERLLRDALLIRGRLAEVALATGEVAEVDGRFADVRRAATALLSCSPSQAVGWLALFWSDLQDGKAGSAQTLEMLRRSYLSGPHEFWVQVRRNPLALAIYDGLPNDLKARALGEFVEILQAGGYAQAASILVGPGHHVASLLLERAAPLPDHPRRMLARQLRIMGEAIVVPGIEPRDPRWR